VTQRPNYNTIWGTHGFGLIEVMVAAGLMTVLASGMIQFMSQNNRGILGMRTTASRDTLKSLLARYAGDPLALDKSRTFSGTSLFAASLNGGSKGFTDCTTNLNCDTTPRGFVLVDPQSSVIAGPAGDINNLALFNTDGALCGSKTVKAICPIAVEVTFVGVCPNGAASCTNATAITVNYRIYHAIDPLTSGPVALNGGTTMKEMKGSVTTLLPLNLSNGGTGNYLAKWLSGTNLGNSIAYEKSNSMIGIGTTNPSNPLEVFLSNSSGGYPIRTSTEGIYGGLLISTKNPSASVKNRAWGVAGMNSFAGTTGLQFWEYEDSNDNGAFCEGGEVCTPRMSVAAGGYVGIGTATPTRALQIGVTGSWIDTSGILLKGANPGLEFADTQSTSQRWLLANGVDTPNDGKFGVAYDINNNRHNIVITTTGRIGMGTTSPDQKLQVVGKLHITDELISDYTGVTTFKGGLLTKGNLNGEGDATFSGTVTANSDRRLKTDIEPLKNSLEKILAIQGVSYRLKDPKRHDKKHIGVIAQDVEKSFPELVLTGDNGLKSVAYQNLVAPLIEAVREQNQQIKTLQETNAKLSQDVEQLRKEVREMRGHSK
jgi:hypothetical protein